MFFTKLSLFLLYLRLFAPNRNTRFLVLFGIGFTALFYTSCLLVEAIACSPWHGETWIEAQLSKRCGRNKLLGYVMAIVNVVIDFNLLAIPIAMVSKLQMPLRKKVGLCILFASGFL